MHKRKNPSSSLESLSPKLFPGGLAPGRPASAACLSSSLPASSLPASSWRSFSLVWLWPWGLLLLSSWDLFSPASLQLAWEPVSQREPAPSPASLPRCSALSLRSPPLRQRVRRLLPALTARCRLRNYPSRGPFHPPLGESSPMCRGRTLCGRSKCALQCLRRCYRTRRALSSVLLPSAICDACFLAHSFI